VRREVFALADFLLKCIPAVLLIGQTDEIIRDLNGTRAGNNPAPLSVEEMDQNIGIVDRGGQTARSRL
jgi:hypothetical protein